MGLSCMIQGYWLFLFAVLSLVKRNLGISTRHTLLNYDRNAVIQELKCLVDTSVTCTVHINAEEKGKQRKFTMCVKRMAFSIVDENEIDRGDKISVEGELCSHLENSSIIGIFNNGVFSGDVMIFSAKEEYKLIENMDIQTSHIYHSLIYKSSDIDQEKYKRIDNLKFVYEHGDHHKPPPEIFKQNLTKSEKPRTFVHKLKQLLEDNNIKFRKSERVTINEPTIENNTAAQKTDPNVNPTPNGKKRRGPYCSTKIYIHSSYAQDYAIKESAVIEAMSMFKKANAIFRENFVNGVKKPYLEFVVTGFTWMSADKEKQMTPFTTNPRRILSDFNGIADKSCSKVLFTRFNWEEVLGMAYIGNLRDTGICGTNNGVILTSFALGEYINPFSQTFVLVHEIGHNLGAQHDPVADCDKNCYKKERLDECSPGMLNGYFIMYPTANYGFSKNNLYFSPCSKEQIIPLLESAIRTTCLLDEVPGVCGNGIVEKDEECDAGAFSESCCGAPNSDTPCKLAKGAVCSPSQGPCCSVSCQYLKTDTVCYSGSDCKDKASCDGKTAKCEITSLRAEKTPCNSGRSLCDAKGDCNMSLCSLIKGAVQCPCPDKANECKLCCKEPKGTCKLYEQGTVKSINLVTGSTCGVSGGYCTDKGTCKKVINQSVITEYWQNILEGKFYKNLMDSVKNDMVYYSLAICGGIVLCIILTFLLKTDKAAATAKKIREIESRVVDTVEDIY